MNHVKLLIVSDVHLERVNAAKQDFLLSAINMKVEEIKTFGFDPVVVCAGDINNSTLGYDFLSQINAKVLYVAGNHEFWEHDYYETIHNLHSKSPSNVTFLHNELIVCGQYLILGSTLWTDVGQNLNKDLFLPAGGRMNDMSFITAKKWYEESRNVERLKEYYSGYDLDDKIANKRWNALIEVDENKLGWNFLDNVGSILKAIAKAQSINEQLHKDLVAKHDWWRIDKKILSETKQKINLVEKGLNWKKFIENLSSLHKNYTITEEEKTEFLKDSNNKEFLFQKIRFIEDVTDKELVVLSHHLPFYEEILVGTYVQEKNPVVNLCNPVDENIFLVRHGSDYPGANYLARATKGDLERHKDITHIVNYYNDGANLLNDYILQNAKMWIHGHEHHFRYRDYVKGIQIVANTAGSSLTVLDTSSGQLMLNKHYMTYHQIKEEDVENEINKIKQSLILEPLPDVGEERLRESIKLWALKYYNWTEHFRCLKRIERASKEILLLSVDYIKREESEDEKIQSTTGVIEEKIAVWNDSYNFNCQKLKKLHEELLLAYHVRIEREFNFQSYLTKSFFKPVDIYAWTMGNASPPEHINEGMIGIFNAKKSFEAKGNIKIAMKYAEKLENFLSKTSYNYVYQVKQKHIDNFNYMAKNAITKDRILEKINEKWELFYSKTFSNPEPSDDDF